MSCSPAHRSLHSFPTRRSSDLRHVFAKCVGTHDPSHIEEQSSYYGDFSEIVHPSPVDDTPMVSDDILRLLPDRKSTRLNSSHRCISYAVFCLKKKNK